MILTVNYYQNNNKKNTKSELIKQHQTANVASAKKLKKLWTIGYWKRITQNYYNQWYDKVAKMVR